MKKIILTLSCIAFALAANAQIIIGGNLGFSTQNSHMKQSVTNGANTIMTETNGPKTSSFNFEPKVGFQINEKLSAGIVLSYGRTGYSKLDNMLINGSYQDGTHKISQTAWGISPYLRYNVASKGDLTFFAEASLPFYGIGPEKWRFKPEQGEQTKGEDHTKTFAWGFQVTPGFNYKLGGVVSLDLYIDLLSLSYASAKYTETETIVNITHETSTTSNQFGFGINTLPGTNTAIRVGVNFAL